MRAHTVILGAGATIATIPDGDKNGKKSSVMNGLIEKLNMQDLLKNIDLKTGSDNLEDIYAELYERPECAEVVKALERRLYKYFAELEIPDDPTIYDMLILSLTSKDVIATFNWDPLLIQAYVRCYTITSNLPHIFCLHGNVGMGFCEDHFEFGAIDAECPICGIKLPPTKLLYPIKQKDYTSDPYIKGCWDAVQYIIENSYAITIFGYSAPKSDVGAINLLKKAWGDINSRSLEEVSIIDVIEEDEILIKWKNFIYTHHYKYTDNFYDSYLGMFPRRSCEMIFGTYQLNIAPDCNKGFKPKMSWEDLEDLLHDVLMEENSTPPNENYPLHYIKEGFFDR